MSYDLDRLRENYLRTLHASLDDHTTMESEAAELAVCTAPDEAHYKKIRKLLPTDTVFEASFHPWPPDDPYDDPENWMPEEELTRAWVWQKGFRPPQQSICVAANFLSKFLANSVKTNQTGSSFAFSGAVALWAHGVTTRPTWSIDVGFRCKNSFRPLIADMVVNPRFVLPNRLQSLDKMHAYTLHLFIRVGPSMGDTDLLQDNLIYTRMSNFHLGSWNRKKCPMKTITIHDTTLEVRPLKVSELLETKLDSHARYRKQRDWEEAYELASQHPKIGKKLGIKCGPML